MGHSSLLNDQQLVRKTRAGEKAAFVEIVTRYQGLVVGTALAVLKDFALSEDAAQETFLIAWKKLDTLRDEKKLKGWLTIIARKTALGYLRKRRRECSFENAESLSVEPGLGPDGFAQKKNEIALVAQALEALPEKYRLPLILFYREEESTREVAFLLGLEEATVRQQIHRGREMVRHLLEGKLGDLLSRTAPSATFTIGVTSAIGALAPPVAVAASVTGSQAVSSFVTSSGVEPSTTATVMTAQTKISFSSLVAALVISIPVGYGLSHWQKKEEKSRGISVMNLGSEPTSISPATLNPLADSPTVIAWRDLVARHGEDAAALPLIRAEIRKLPSNFSRRALEKIFYGKWVRVDPAAAYAKGDYQVEDAWIKADPAAAIAAIREKHDDPDERFLRHIVDIARVAPELVLPLLQEMSPDRFSMFSSYLEGAFAILAAEDPLAVLETARRLDGVLKKSALNAAIAQWSRISPADAYAWASQNKEGQHLVSGVLATWAGVEPKKALQEMLRNEKLHGSNNIVILAAGADLEGTFRWLGEHPEAMGEHGRGLQYLVAQELSHDPILFLDLLVKTKISEQGWELFGGTSVNGLPPNISMKWREVSRWLEGQPDSPFKADLSQHLIDDLATRNGDALLEFFQKHPSSQTEETSVRVAEIFLRQGDALEIAEDYAERIPELKEALYKNAFLRSSNNPAMDVSRLMVAYEALGQPEELTQSLLTAWIPQDIQGAEEWCFEDPDVEPEKFFDALDQWSGDQSGGYREWFYESLASNELEEFTPYLGQRIFGNSASDERSWQWLEQKQEEGFGGDFYEAAGLSLRLNEEQAFFEKLAESGLSEENKGALKKGAMRMLKIQGR
jgi:RNA polymerase sigma factor (sigma-70 family)